MWSPEQHTSMLKEIPEGVSAAQGLPMRAGVVRSGSRSGGYAGFLRL